MKTNSLPSSPTTPQQTPPANSSLGARLLTAAIGIPLVLLVVWTGGIAFGLVVTALALIGLRELDVAMRRAGIPLVGDLVYPALAFMLWIGWRYTASGDRGHYGAPLVFFTMWLIPVALLVIGVFTYGLKERMTLTRLAHTQMAFYYCGLFVFLILLRGLPQWSHQNAGLHLFCIVLAGVWSGDSFAYFAGRAFGKKPLAKLSPKKTLEGTLVGVLFAVAICIGLAFYLGFGWQHGVVLGLLIAIATPLGDLAESFWKRELEIKDLGSILPGHGGVLDRCDSLLFACFAVYLYAVWAL